MARLCLRRGSADRRLNKIRALAAFSPDALSSIAYANQEIYLGLVVAGQRRSCRLPSRSRWPSSACCSIVALSYYQTIHAYPSGGGSWIVARANLGIGAGLVAAAALLLDYVLTAAVSLTAGVEAIASAFPALWPYRVTAGAVPAAADHAPQPARPARNRDLAVGARSMASWSRSS